MKVLQDCFSQSLVKKSFHSVWATRQLACKRMTTMLILDSTSWVMVLFKLAYSLEHCAYSCIRVLSVYSRTQRVFAYSACIRVLSEYSRTQRVFAYSACIRVLSVYSRTQRVLRVYSLGLAWTCVPQLLEFGFNWSSVAASIPRFTAVM